MVNRYKILPAFFAGYGGYAELLHEARELYIDGKYYSCVAMSGITAERLAKDLLYAVITFEKEGKSFPANHEQLKQIDRIELNIVRELLFSSGIIDNDTKKAFTDIAELRNKYAHGVGDDKQKDAENAIKHLHKIIEGSVSIDKYYDIKDGKYVEKNNTSVNTG